MAEAIRRTTATLVARVVAVVVARDRWPLVAQVGQRLRGMGTPEALALPVVANLPVAVAGTVALAQTG